MILSLLAAGWTRRREPSTNAGGALTSLLFVGILSTGVLPMIPASRDHYFALGTILILALLAVAWKRQGPFRIPTRWVVLFGTIFALQIAVQFPRLGLGEDVGNVIWAELILWSAGVYQLWKLTRFSEHVPHKEGGAIVRS